jgi:hypothetical protein
MSERMGAFRCNLHGMSHHAHQHTPSVRTRCSTEEVTCGVCYSVYKLVIIEFWPSFCVASGAVLRFSKHITGLYRYYALRCVLSSIEFVSSEAWFSNSSLEPTRCNVSIYLFIFTDTLHFSGCSSSAHHQEHISVHTT